jgi:hypothetical protein
MPSRRGVSVYAHALARRACVHVGKSGLRSGSGMADGLSRGLTQRGGIDIMFVLTVERLE